MTTTLDGHFLQIPPDKDQELVALLIEQGYAVTGDDALMSKVVSTTKRQCIACYRWWQVGWVESTTDPQARALICTWDGAGVRWPVRASWAATVKIR